MKNWRGQGDTASHWFTQYRCFLPDLAGFSGSNCAAPQSHLAAAARLNGESGIRTHGGVTPTHAFQACSLNHSDISPKVLTVKTTFRMYHDLKLRLKRTRAKA